MRNRIEASRRSTENRESVTLRRARTRHLIELGGLVQKAGLVELTGDDGAMMLGAFLRMAELLQSVEGETNRELCWCKGKRGFAIDDAE